MYLKVPEVRRCCFCIPLRYGIMVFGIVNIVLSVIAVVCLVVTTELSKVSLTNDLAERWSLEEVTATVLFSILGMGVILNCILVVGGSQKDISMLRLYNYYAVLTTMTALVPLFILLYRKQYKDVYAAVVAIAMQIYVIVLVRSETLKLEKKKLSTQDCQRDADVEINVPDTDALL